jgi:hypothetical protein
MAGKNKDPRPPKADLPGTKPATDKAQIAALWAAVAALTARVARLEGDDDTRAAVAALLRQPKKDPKP